jgi:diamine N-acetyltransferase
MIHLAPITKDNYRECLKLKVSDSEARLVASTAKALADAYVYYSTARPFAIYEDDLYVMSKGMKEQ